MAQILDNKIEQLIEQTSAIASFVRQEDWDTVDQLTHQRQLDLEKFFRTPVEAAHAKAVAKMIRKILSIDSEMVVFIEQEKKRTFNKFANLQNNNKAHQTYKNVASLS